MSEIKLKLTAGTNVGLIRQNNEDNFTVCASLSEQNWIIPQVGDSADLGEYGALLVVADGMGGANAGEVASAIAVSTIQEEFVPDKMSGILGDDQSIQQFMRNAVNLADMRIVNRSEQDESTKGMGTTIVMAWLLGSRAYVCWCGDSRCYVFNTSRGLVRLSKDHSYVQELVDHGKLHPDLTLGHPYSNIITRCLGSGEKRAQPETIIYEMQDGDIFLLCTDGLCGLCSDNQIGELVSCHIDDLVACKEELIAAALEAGGDDNVTVALAAVAVAGEKSTPTELSDDQNDESTSEESDTLMQTVKDLPGREVKNRSKISWLIGLIVILGLILYYFLWYSRTGTPL